MQRGGHADLRIQVQEVRGVRDGPEDERSSSLEMPDLQGESRAPDRGDRRLRAQGEQLGFQDVLYRRRPEKDNGSCHEADGWGSRRGYSEALPYPLNTSRSARRAREISFSPIPRWVTARKRGNPRSSRSTPCSPRSSRKAGSPI